MLIQICSNGFGLLVSHDGMSKYHLLIDGNTLHLKDVDRKRVHNKENFIAPTKLFINCNYDVFHLQILQVSLCMQLNEKSRFAILIAHKKFWCPISTAITNLLLQVQILKLAISSL
jgi:hypothetical protein